MFCSTLPVINPITPREDYMCVRAQHTAETLQNNKLKGFRDRQTQEGSHRQHNIYRMPHHISCKSN